MTLTLSPSAAILRSPFALNEREVMPGTGPITKLPSMVGSPSAKNATTVLESISEFDVAIDADRPTTSREKLIAEVRQFAFLTENWDTQGAGVPNSTSVQHAVHFACLLSAEAAIPEATIFQTGHAGLFWHSADIYADLEFLDDGRIAYFIERAGERHKGVAKFNSQEMPAVFEALLDV